MISSILPTSPKELSSCSSERSVFLALLDYRRPRRLPFTCLPPPACRAAYASAQSKAVPRRARLKHRNSASAWRGVARPYTGAGLPCFHPRPLRPGQPGRAGRNQQAVARPAGAKVFHCAARLRNPAPRQPQLGPK